MIKLGFLASKQKYKIQKMKKIIVLALMIISANGVIAQQKLDRT
jgi:hypothetical protein